MTRKRQSPRSAQEADRLLEQVASALRSMGWLLPVREHEVADAEAELAASPVALPPSLQDPAAVLSPIARAGAVEPTVLEFPGSPAVDATLSRAAREGGRLTPDIEERMRRDRQAAEAEADRRRGHKAGE